MFAVCCELGLLALPRQQEQVSSSRCGLHNQLTCAAQIHAKSSYILAVCVEGMTDGQQHLYVSSLAQSLHKNIIQAYLGPAALLRCRVRVQALLPAGRRSGRVGLPGCDAAPTAAGRVVSWGVDGNALPLGRAAADPRRPALVGLPVHPSGSCFGRGHGKVAC